ncbi:MAG: efflux RND transporter periplasmic adaptor subunit [Aquabacterium sp.]|uniref:efflux RND transporter periplasmic adaptor subunit n=1 Tax=Aquabacterium sp. TaxID=1872578 RepID=UPI0027190996|nr:efflux RND transporter periplasmic adaptor subunit [Aquabacterium sp.]MDO9002720.1 efflux RND transporter periplasmic adaptor subunit [Aquabacterium sp.]
MSMPPRTRLFAFVLATPLLLATVGCGKTPPAPEPVRAVRTLVLSETGGAVDREFSAEIRARIESRLSFRVPGKVLRRQVELGQAVKPGQVLAQLDPQDLTLTQESARAGLAAAEANAAQAAADFKRFNELKGQGFISAAELDRHSTALKSAEASLRQARAQAGVQGNQATYATLTANASGVITAVDAEPGQVVSAGTPVLTLAQDGPRDALFSVPEDMAPTMRALLNKPGAIKVRRWGTQEWLPAKIREVSAATDSVTRTFLVKADVGQGAYELGQTATVALSTPVRFAGGLRVPLQALVEQNGRSAVWVLDGSSMTVKAQPVVTADVTGNIVIVASGLKAGQEIVTAGVHVLKPGQKVKRYQTALDLAAAPPAAASVSQPAVSQ